MQNSCFPIGRKKEICLEPANRKAGILLCGTYSARFRDFFSFLRLWWNRNSGQTGPFFARPPPFDIKKSQQCRIVALPAAKSWKFAGRLPARQSALPNFCQAENLAMTKVKGNFHALATWLYIYQSRGLPGNLGLVMSDVRGLILFYHRVSRCPRAGTWSESVSGWIVLTRSRGKLGCEWIRIIKYLEKVELFTKTKV